MSQSQLIPGAPADVPLGKLPVLEPSADLWQRICDAHRRRTRRRRQLRAAAALGAGVLLLAFWLGYPYRADAPGRLEASAIDWQARAQALEMQLRAARGGGDDSNGTAREARGEIALVDAALQAAYDDGASRDQVRTLWKRRSELLSILLAVHRHDIEVSRI